MDSHWALRTTGHWALTSGELRMDRVASLMYISPMDEKQTGRHLYSGERVELRRLAREDREELTRLARASGDLYHPWIHAPTTDEEFDSYLARFNRETAEGFLISIRNTDTLAGFININEIIRGPYQRGTLGYGAFAPSTGKGYMAEGLRLLFRFAFEDLRLHRLEADIQPGNTASLNLVKKLGFRLEGFSPGFIYIKDEWRDHERWAITNEMPGARSWLTLTSPDDVLGRKLYHVTKLPTHKSADLDQRESLWAAYALLGLGLLPFLL